MHLLQRIHFVSSMRGYGKPFSSGCIVIAPLGQTAKQALQPQQAALGSARLGTGFLFISIEPTSREFY